MPTQPMDKTAASRIQSSQSKNNQDTGAGTFAARIQSAADKNTNAQGQGQGQEQGQANTGQKK
jgi:hypothetical protein